MANNNNRPSQQRQPYGHQDETGFADPLGNCTDFNLLNFINNEDGQMPADSPAVDMRFFQQQHAQQQQLQHPQQQQQPTYFNPTVHIPSMEEEEAGVSPPMMGRGSVEQQAMKVSPNSDYLGSYLAQTPASHGQISPPDIVSQQQRVFLMNAQQQQQENFPIDLYLAGNEDLSDLNIGDFGQPTATAVPVVIGQKRRRTAVPMEEIKCDPSAFINSAANIDAKSAGSNGNMPLMSASSTNSSMNNEQSFDDWDESANGNNGNGQRTIRFSPFQPQTWAPLFDGQHTQLSQLPLSVVADKGFSYSAPEGCFINQKKNHFQITVLVKPSGETPPVFVFTPDTGLKEIRCFKVAFYGVKAEMLTSEIPIRQSASDRRPQPHMPEVVEVDSMVAKQKTIARLHFAETTMNNNRKNNKPNPDQRYFHLLVKFFAETTDGLLILVQAHASDKVIVRASNPGQFENQENELMWQKAGYNNIIHYGGPVAIGTDRPVGDAQLTVHGNIVSTGQHTRPSDRRVKEDILSVDPKAAMDRIAQVRVVEYSYKPDIAKEWGLKEEERHRVGVIAQELAQVIPDAVRDNGEFLTVDDTRLFYDAVAAQQQLHQMNGNLEGKVGQVEEISVRLARYLQKHRRNMGASMASGLSDLSTLLANYPHNRDGQQRQPTSSAGLNGQSDEQSALSHSRLSLNSTCSADPSINPSQIGSASQYGRYYGRKRGRRDEPQLCNSRLTQATMVGLVVIMSICLVAMCTLYVLDWYNRTYVYTHHQYPHVEVGPDPGNIIMEIPNNWLPPAQPLVRPLLSTCMGVLGTKCPTYCCGRAHTFNASGDAEKTVVVPMPDSSNAQKEAMELPDNSSPKHLKSGVSIRLIDMNVLIDGKYCVENSCLPRKGRYNLYVPMSPFLPSIPMHLKFSIDAETYVESCGWFEKIEPEECESETDENKENEEKKTKSTSTHDFEEEKPKRDWSALPKILKVQDNIFELPAGQFLQSAFRFRVGHTADACTLADDQQGRSFDEYNIVFYRKCD